MFPQGLANDHDECRRQILAVTGEDQHLDDMLSAPEMEVDLYQRLLDYWRREASPSPDVDLSTVQTAADLLAVVSDALGLPGRFGNNLDAFGEALIRAVDLPSTLSLSSWNRVAELMPRDSELLLECFRELGKMYPECWVEVYCL